MTNEKDVPRSGASESVDDIDSRCREVGACCSEMDRRDFVKAIGLGGELSLRRFSLPGFDTKDFEQVQILRSGEEIRFTLTPRGSV